MSHSPNEIPRNKIRIAQLNMARSQAVSDQALVYCQNERIDILLAQEPYTRYGKMPPFETAPYRVILKEGNRTGERQSASTWSSIVILNPAIVVLSLGHLSSMHCAVANVGYPGGTTIVLMSAYFQFRRATQQFTHELHQIISKLQPSDNLIIGADVNAFSTRWGSRTTDHRGSVVEDFIDQNDLTLINTHNHGPTYVGPRGSTNIDISLSREIDMDVSSWKIVKGETTSDHHIIRFDISISRPKLDQVSTRRFNTRKANWSKFDAILVQEHLNTIYSSDPDINVDKITEAITKAAISSIPRSTKQTKPTPPWWSEELSKLRQDVRRAHHRLLNIGSESLDAVTVQYRVTRNKYVSALRKAKYTSWTTFTTSGNEEKWGKCYKWLKKGSVKQQIPTALKRQDGTFTSTMLETLNTLLDSLIPIVPGEDRCVVAQSTVHEDVELCEELEVKQAIWRMNPKKAPGLDNLNGHIIKRSWLIIKDPLVSTFNSCLKMGKIPEKWKTADLVIIGKGQGKEPTDPKSYRPISLLTTMSKALEHIICTRLKTQIEKGMSKDQHGFTNNRSTYSAIKAIIDWTNTRESKYVLGVFLDISGAFDNLNWKSLIGDMEALGAKPYIISLVKSYLHGRKVHLKKDHTSVTRTLTRGCPQGSEFGPLLWNIAVNKLLTADRPQWTARTAYADDLVIQVTADTRTQLIKRAEEALLDLLPWAAERTLTFSAPKSLALVMKGGLTPGFTIGFHGKRIRSVERLKYLGLWIGTDVNFSPQVESILSNSNDLFSRMKGASGHSWGYTTNTKMLFYKTIYLTRITYGSMFWAQEIRTKKIAEKIQSAQRRALLAITKAYRTTSTPALQVLAGVLPLDLAIRCEAAKQANRWSQEQINLTELNNEILQTWQDRWDLSIKGRETFAWLPNIKTRLLLPIDLNPFIVQFMTGHGDFKAKLYSFNLTNSPECECGQGPETSDHVLLHCRRVDDYRRPVKDALLRSNIQWPPEKIHFTINNNVFNTTCRFARKALEDRTDR